MSRRLSSICLSLSLVSVSVACGGEEPGRSAQGSGGSGEGGSGGEGRGGAASSGDAGGAGGSCLSGGVGGADAASCDGPGARFATGVESACFGSGQDFGRDEFPDIVFGPPRGAGCCGGSLDVMSLGNGGSIVLSFGQNAIVDGPGPDFLVFENAFYLGDDEEHPFAELATVEVSADGVGWSAFPCSAVEPPYGSCAGWHPVFANPEANGIDPLDPAAAGGDPFDLADLDVPLARFVRITDRADTADVFDLDAVAVVNARCP
jgi:hypothetical protein